MLRGGRRPRFKICHSKPQRSSAWGIRTGWSSQVSDRWRGKPGMPRPLSDGDPLQRQARTPAHHMVLGHSGYRRSESPRVLRRFSAITGQLLSRPTVLILSRRRCIWGASPKPRQPPAALLRRLRAKN